MLEQFAELLLQGFGGVGRLRFGLRLVFFGIVHKAVYYTGWSWGYTSLQWPIHWLDSANGHEYSYGVGQSTGGG